MLELAGDAQAVAEIRRSHEQHVDAVDRGNLRDARNGRGRLDLDDPENIVVERPNLRMRHAAEPRAAGQQRHAADAIGRVAQVRHRLPNLVDRVEAGDHDPGRAQVERPADPDPLARGGTDQGSGRRDLDRREDGHEARLVPGAMLEVDDQPVEAGPGTQLGGRRRI